MQNGIFHIFMEYIINMSVGETAHRHFERATPLKMMTGG